MAAQPKPLHLEQVNYLEGGGIYSWLTTIDHKRIAVLYGVTAMLFMALGGTEAMFSPGLRSIVGGVRMARVSRENVLSRVSLLSEANVGPGKLLFVTMSSRP